MAKISSLKLSLSMFLTNILILSFEESWQVSIYLFNIWEESLWNEYYLAFQMMLLGLHVHKQKMTKGSLR